MAQYYTREVLEQQARIVTAPDAPTPAVVDRSFGLPTGVYATTVGLYMGFLAVMALGMSSPGLIIPIAICTIFIVMLFGTPALWTRMAPEHRARPLAWQQFCNDGIATLTGQVTARDAAVQVLLLPALVFCWGLVVVTIAALV